MQSKLKQLKMKEIKFRGKRIDNNQYMYGWFCSRYNMPAIMDETELMAVVPESVGQFTGLKDKNGFEIYEGDIILADWHFDKPTLVSLDYKDSFFYAVEEYCLEDVLEVIGNIYENPELYNPTI